MPDTEEYQTAEEVSNVGITIQAELIHKGKIFCTNQEYYSIQNGEYIAQDRDDTYITR